jgi:hypothetical protein
MHYFFGALAQLLHIGLRLRCQVEARAGRLDYQPQAGSQAVTAGRWVLDHVAVPFQSDKHAVDRGFADPVNLGKLRNAALAPPAEGPEDA